MNKIVCNLCGTSYPDTESQCPICGTAKADDSKSTAGGEGGYAYVKGGRFSKSNVRKHNAGQNELPRVVAPVKKQAEKPEAEPAREQKPNRSKQEKKEGKGSNVVLALIAALLIIAIIVACAYLAKYAVKELFPNDDPVGSNTGSTPSTNRPEPVPCTGLTLALTKYQFTVPGETLMISATPTPENTTDPFRFVSTNEKVATVDENGVITAVANGSATIFVYCGEQVALLEVTCNVGVEPEPDTQPSNPDVELLLNRTEFTLNGYGTSHMLYDGELDPADIQWSSSDDSVAAVKDGKVTAVGNGTAVITAEYMSQTVTCTVHCENVTVSDYELRTRYGRGDDFTIYVGDSIVLNLTEKGSGLLVQAEDLSFALSKEGVITINSKGKITAVGTGTVTVTVTYGDLTFKAIVRVPK